MEGGSLIAIPSFIRAWFLRYSGYFFVPRALGRVLLFKGMIRKHSNTQIFLVIMKVFSYDFGVPSIVHFPLFESNNGK